jgi:hypothetical protein
VLASELIDAFRHAGQEDEMRFQRMDLSGNTCKGM